VKKEEQAKNAATFSECATFLHSILGNNAKADASLDEVMQLPCSAIDVTKEEDQAGAASGSRDTFEPEVVYIHERWNCRVPPGEVELPGKILGKFFWGGLSPVLNESWLRWKRVTHVLNCLGATNGDVPNRHYTLAMNARVAGIKYFNWCINSEECRTNYLLTFSKLALCLSTQGTCLYVHCKSGRDRSVMTVIALLRSQFSVSDEKACTIVNSRLGVDKWPCAILKDKKAYFKWIDSILS